MKYTFVGDIHGKVDCVKEALSRDGQIIFVGDFIDSFDKTLTEHSECFQLVLDACKKGKARAIYGNHELSYLMPSKHQYSGYTSARRHLVLQFARGIAEYFEPYILLEPTVLVSHAGLTSKLWLDQKLTFDLLPQILDEWWPDHKSPMHYIGQSRGGNDPYGGLFWCDFRQEFYPVPGLTQVFGHTRGTGIRQIENSYCIDCLDQEQNFLVMKL